jgi:hypothetical protein
MVYRVGGQGSSSTGPQGPPGPEGTQGIAGGLVTLSWPTINGKTVGNTKMTTGSAQRFIPVMLRLETIAISGLVTAPNFAIGTNSPTYNNIFNPGVLSSLIPNVVNNLKGYEFAEVASLAPSTDIYVRVSVAAVATTYQFRPDLIGYYAP